jgi:SAM-dependent methyltransferase
MTSDSDRTKCASCGTTRGFVQIRDHVRHGIPRRVLQCGECSLVFLAPRADESPGTFYDSEYRKLYSPTPGTAVTAQQLFEIYHPLQAATIAQLAPYLTPTARVLEIGCSAGQLLAHIQKRVASCVGVELNTEHAAFAARKLGVKVFTDPIEQVDLPAEAFDVVVTCQTFEHVPEPQPFLQAVRRLLAPQGVLHIEVPNLADPLVGVYKVEPYLEFYYREPHVFYYTQHTLKRVMESGGFNVSFRTYSQYGLVNHLSWVLTGKPQPDPKTAMNPPAIGSGPILEFLRRADGEYRDMLAREGLADTLVCIARRQ